MPDDPRPRDEMDALTGDDDLEHDPYDPGPMWIRKNLPEKLGKAFLAHLGWSDRPLTVAKLLREAQVDLIEGLPVVRHLIHVGDVRPSSQAPDGPMHWAIEAVIAAPLLDAMFNASPMDAHVWRERFRHHFDPIDSSAWTIERFRECQYAGSPYACDTQADADAVVAWLDEDPENALMPTHLLQIVPNLKPGGGPETTDNLAKSLRTFTEAMMWRAVQILEDADEKGNPATLDDLCNVFLTHPDEEWRNTRTDETVSARTALRRLLDQAVGSTSIRQIRAGSNPSYSTGEGGRAADAKTLILIELDRQRETTFREHQAQASQVDDADLCCRHRRVQNLRMVSRADSNIAIPGLTHKELMEKSGISSGGYISETVKELRDAGWVTGKGSETVRLIRPLSRLLLQGIVAAMPSNVSVGDRVAALADVIDVLRRTTREGVLLGTRPIGVNALFAGFKDPHLETLLSRCSVHFFRDWTRFQDQWDRDLKTGQPARDQVGISVDPQAYPELDLCATCGKPFGNMNVVWEPGPSQPHEWDRASTYPHHVGCSPTPADVAGLPRMDPCQACGGHLWVQTPVPVRLVEVARRESPRFREEFDDVALILARARRFADAVPPNPAIKERLDRLLSLDLMSPEGQRAWRPSLLELRDLCWRPPSRMFYNSKPDDKRVIESSWSWVGGAHRVAEAQADGKPVVCRWKDGSPLHVRCATLRTATPTT